MLECQINDGLERIRKGTVMALLRYDLGICLVGLRKSMENLSGDSRCPGKDSNQAPHKYENRELPLSQPARFLRITK
jgi:hypothetical protein